MDSEEKNVGSPGDIKKRCHGMPSFPSTVCRTVALGVVNRPVGDLKVMIGANSDANSGPRPERRWDVALSFAGAQRDYVKRVAEALKARGVRCFYDADEQVRLWGTHLAEELPRIYARESAAVVVFISADYAGRDWTRLERRAAFSRAVAEAGVYMLPARFDDSELPGLLPDVVAVDLRSYTPDHFADLVIAKLADLAISTPTRFAFVGSPGESSRQLHARPANLVISYSRRDERYMKQLTTHLAGLRREGLIADWYDRMITAGDEWHQTIDDSLETSDCVLPLISPDFIASDYCYSVEMEKALQKHQEGRSLVIPVIVRPADWQRTRLGNLQVLPKDGKPVVEWPSRDRAWLNVTEGLRHAITRFMAKGTT